MFTVLFAFCLNEVHKNWYNHHVWTLVYANNKSADQPAHPSSLINTFVVHCLDSITSLVSILAISSLYLASEAEQTGLSLPWSQTPKTGFLATKLTECRHILQGADVGFLRSHVVAETRVLGGNHWPCIGDHYPATMSILGIEPGPQQWQARVLM